MSVWATIIVTRPNQAAAQALTSDDMFIAGLKKTLRYYFFSSGYFSQEDYNALLDSDLIHSIETDATVRPSQTFADLGMTRIIEED
jgi:hypothetical protein